MISPAMIQQAAQQASQQGRRAIEVLQDQVALNAVDFVSQLAASLHYQSIALAQMQTMRPVFELLSFSECLQHGCVLLEKGNQFILVLADIYNKQLETSVASRIQRPFSSYLAHHADIAAFLSQHEESTRTVESAISGAHTGAQQQEVVEELSLNRIESDVSSVVKLVRSTLFDALKSDASDVHLETVPNGIVIKYRLDGVLSQVGAVSEPGMAEQIVSRIKVMAALDITEQRVPQDGRFRASYRGRDIDFRVSVMPSIHGEDIVIRVLDKQALAEEANGLNLSVLGLDAHTQQVLRTQFQMPYGMVLVTGPTGSGKTTTLYAAISEINRGVDKIITIEDPVEYQLPGVLQIPVNEKKGLTFARGLRSILRHDPDKIMVGEIRDAETAQIAVQSALTGHLVFTTVHANNVFDVIGRFLNMGVDPYSFVSALNVVVAQRLLRVICQHCAQPVKEIESHGIAIPPHATLRHAPGCGACRGTGYKGRHAVAEVLVLDDELRELIAGRAAIRQIKELATKKGTKFLHQAALEMAFSGQTTLAEVQRVAPVIE
jgi:general secretion pathway protein E